MNNNLSDNRSIPTEEFNWDAYENGYDGTNLVINKNVKTIYPKDNVYCHELYAQEEYDMFAKWFGEKFDNNIEFNAKDVLLGNIFDVVDIRGVSDHEVLVDTAGGVSGVIDLNKEKDFLKLYVTDSPAKFINALNVDYFKNAFLESKIVVKVVAGKRFSLWDGHLAKIEHEFMDQINNPNASKYAYEAYVKQINGGGFIVNVSGIDCFLPGSLAAAGIISDFESMIGKTVMVMVVNYVPKSGFVVSYKKYLYNVLPQKIDEELYAGLRVLSKVTGISRNGLFVQFQDKEGNWIFSGLVHRSVMSKEFENRFNKREFSIGDEITLFISNITTKDGQTRIVLTDKEVVLETENDSSNN